MANAYLNRQLNGKVPQSFMDGIGQSFEATTELIDYLYDISIDSANEQELECIGLWIGFPRPYIANDLLTGNAFIFCKLADQIDGVYINALEGFSSLAHPETGGRFISLTQTATKLPIDYYRAVLKKIAYIKYNGWNMNSIDYLMQLPDVDYTLSFVEYSSLLSTSSFTGVKLAKLSSTSVATINGTSLKMYVLSDGVWAQEGNTLTISLSGDSLAITALDSTTISVYDRGSKDLMAYKFTSPDWALFGSVKSLSATNDESSITALTSTSVALLDSSGLLETYTLSAGTWSKTGNSLSLSFGDSKDRIEKIYSAIVAVWDAGGQKLRSYSWDGTDWTETGNDLSLIGIVGGYVEVSYIEDNRILVYDSSSDKIHSYSWDGTDWSVTGSTINIAYTCSGLICLSTTLFLTCTASTTDKRLYEINTDVGDIDVNFDTEISSIYVALLQLVLDVFMTAPQVNLIQP